MFYRVGLAGGFFKAGIYLGQCCPCGSVGGCGCCAWGSVPVGFARFIFGQGILAEGFIRGVLGGGVCHGGFVRGWFVRGVCPGWFWRGGDLSRGFFPDGFCPRGFCPGGFCPGCFGWGGFGEGFCSVVLAGGGGVSGGVFTRGYFV